MRKELQKFGDIKIKKQKFHSPKNRRAIAEIDDDDYDDDDNDDDDDDELYLWNG